MSRREWAPIEDYVGEDKELHDPEVFAPVHWKQLAGSVAGSAGILPEWARLTTCAMMLWALQADSSEFDDGVVAEFIQAADCDLLTPLWAEGGDAVTLVDRIEEVYR